MPGPAKLAFSGSGPTTAPRPTRDVLPWGTAWGTHWGADVGRALVAGQGTRALSEPIAIARVTPTAPTLENRPMPSHSDAPIRATPAATDSKPVDHPSRETVGVRQGTGPRATVSVLNSFDGRGSSGRCALADLFLLGRCDPALDARQSHTSARHDVPDRATNRGGQHHAPTKHQYDLKPAGRRLWRPRTWPTMLVVCHVVHVDQ